MMTTKVKVLDEQAPYLEKSDAKERMRKRNKNTR